MEKPSVDEIIALEKKLREDVYGEAHNEFRDDEKYYELDFNELLGLPTEVSGDGTVLPTARDLVDTAVDHTDISNARVFANKKSLITKPESTKTEDESAEMMRKFGLGLIYRTNTESPISPWRVGAKHFWAYGVCWFKDVWDADMWPDKPSQKKGESDEVYAERIEKWQGETELTIPIILRAINPINILPDPNHIEPQFIIESHEKAYYAISKNYPNWSNPKGKGITNTVKWIEYWDETYKCFLADGEPVIKYGDGVIKHKYGFIPYVEIDSGLGNVDSNGSFKARWVGLLRYIRELLISESRDYSIADIILKKGAWPWYAGEDDQDGAKIRKMTTIDAYYGNIQDFTGIKLTKMQPELPPDYLRVHQALTADILASHAAPRSVRGMSETGVRSGADRRLLMAEAGMRYAHSKDAFQYGTARVLNNCAKLLKYVLPGPVRLWAKTPRDEFDTIIKKELMKEPFAYHVEFAPISEEDEYRRHDDLIRMLQVGLTTKKWSRQQMSNVDALAMEEDEEKEKIGMGLAEVKQQYINDAWMRATAQKQAAENLRAMGQQVPQGMPPQGIPPQGMAPPGGMTTGVPQVAPPGSAQQQQNILRQQRSQAPIAPGQGQGGGGRRWA